MTHYYMHMESNEGGRSAASLCYAKDRLNAIEQEIEELQGEARFLEHVVDSLQSSVCKHCNGQRTMTYYPSGTGPGQGTRSSVPCSTCRPEESKAAMKKLDEEYSRH